MVTSKITSESLATELRLLEEYRRAVRVQVTRQLQDRIVTVVADGAGLSHGTVRNVTVPNMRVSFETLTALVKYFEVNP